MTRQRKMIRRRVPPRTALVLGVLAAAVACTSDTQTAVVDDAFLDIDHIIMEQMENVLTRDGVRSGLVISDSSYIYEDSSTARLFGVHMTLYSENGVEESNLTADEGWLNQRTDELTAQGNVVLTIPRDGRRIETSELHYDPVRDVISSDSSTLQILNGSRTRATCGFTSDLNFRNFNLCGPVGDIPPRGGGD